MSDNGAFDIQARIHDDLKDRLAEANVKVKAQQERIDMLVKLLKLANDATPHYLALQSEHADLVMHAHRLESTFATTESERMRLLKENDSLKAALDMSK